MAAQLIVLLWIFAVNGFKIPKAGCGVMLGGDISKPEMATVAKGLIDLGFKLFCSSPEVEKFINGLPYLSIKRIFVSRGISPLRLSSVESKS